MMTAHGNATRHDRADRPQKKKNRLDRIASRDSQDRTLIGQQSEKKKKERKGKGENRGAFFGRAPARRHYSRKDRKHRAR
jgi:hypothetical protein